jgi:predicted MFS family arabinose efflux permease
VLKNFFGPYAAFLRLPDVTATLLYSWVARMPIGMTALAMLLYFREMLGDFRRAGGLVGVYFIAMAVSAPIQGRIIDQRGPRGMVILTGIAQPVFVLALFFAVQYQQPYPLLFALAALGGLLPPPITVLTRTIWRHRFDEDQQRRMAFSVDAVFVELNFTVGPTLVAGLVAAFGARMAYLITVAVMFASPWVFLKSPSLKYWKQEPPAERHLLGPLTDLRLVVLFILTFGLTFCFGLMEVGYPAYATSIALPAFGGVLLTINSLGSAIGGAVYGGVHVRMSMERQFTWLLAFMVAPLALHGLVDQRTPFAMVAFLAGATIAPAIAAQNLLVARLAPPHYATEAFTWSATFIVCGLGAGMAAGGAIAEGISARAPFLFGAATIAAMALASAWIKPHPAHH